MTKLKDAALAMVLTVGAQDAMAEKPDFQLPVVKGDKHHVVDVHCNRLDKNGNVTPEFVKAMGIESHFSYIDYKIKMSEQKTGADVSDEKRAELYLEHLNGHNHARELTTERVEVGAKHCRENYSHEYLEP